MRFPHLALAGLTLAIASPAAADPILGDWFLPGGASQVRIAPCAEVERLCGEIIWLKHGAGDDGALAKAEPRERAVVGLRLLAGFKAEPGAWTDGRIYDPRSGETYASRMSLAEDGRLRVQTCRASGCETQTWRRD